MKVYVVVTGEDNSGVGVVGAFTNEQDADKLTAAVPDAETLSVDVEDCPPDVPDEDVFNVYVTMNGTPEARLQTRLNSSRERHKEFAVFRTHKDRPDERRSFWRLYGKKYAATEADAVAYFDDIRKRILNGEHPECVDMGVN